MRELKHGTLFEHCYKTNYMKRFIFFILIFSAFAVVTAQVNRTEVLQNLEKNQQVNQEQSLSATLKYSSRLFKTKDDLTTVIMIIPSGSVVKVNESDSTYFKVTFDDNEGYIFKRDAVLTDKPVVVTEQVKEQQNVQQQQEQQPQQRQVSRFTYLENKYGTNMAAKLNAGKIWKGMTSEMVRDSWGTPFRINRASGENAGREEWIYRNTWLYIENNTLTEWGPINK